MGLNEMEKSLDGMCKSDNPELAPDVETGGMRGLGQSPFGGLDRNRANSSKTISRERLRHVGCFKNPLMDPTRLAVV